jgi:hypothetical protein
MPKIGAERKSLGKGLDFYGFIWYNNAISGLWGELRPQQTVFRQPVFKEWRFFQWAKNIVTSSLRVTQTCVSSSAVRARTWLR